MLFSVLQNDFCGDPTSEVNAIICLIQNESVIAFVQFL